MGELLAVTCDSCGEPMVPNVSTLDADGAVLRTAGEAQDRLAGIDFGLPGPFFC